MNLKKVALGAVCATMLMGFSSQADAMQVGVECTPETVNVSIGGGLTDVAVKIPFFLVGGIAVTAISYELNQLKKEVFDNIKWLFGYKKKDEETRELRPVKRLGRAAVAGLILYPCVKNLIS